MDLIDALETSWADGAALVKGLAADDLGAATPCAGWDVRSLVNHTFAECLMATNVNHGHPATYDETDMVADGRDLPEAWNRIASANVASWRDVGLDGTRTYFYGTFPARAALTINLGEVVVHNWDLAQALGVPFEVDPAAAQVVFDIWAAQPLDRLREHGVLGPEVPVPVDAPISDRMLGLLGREPR